LGRYFCRSEGIEGDGEREEGMNTGSFPIKMGAGLKAGRKTSTTDVSWFPQVHEAYDGGW
jgi:hypothetical protein